MNSQQRKKNNKKRLLYAALFVVLIALITAGSFYVSRHFVKSINQNTTRADLVLDKPVETPPVSNDVALPPEPAKKELPISAEISMWFASQAPYGDWSEPWQNGCEEAAIITVKHYLDQQPLNKDIMHDEILQMVDWQNQNWGGNRNLTGEETLRMAKSYYGLNGQVVYEYGTDKIKQFIADGVPVIIPADGRKLNNPNFKNGGPEYHMLVVKGYNSSQFITNDPGTRLGEGYLYPYDIILNSIKNPSGGQKSIFILYK